MLFEEVTYSMELSSQQRRVALEEVVSLLEAEFDGVESEYQHEHLETDPDGIDSKQEENSDNEQKSTRKKRAKAYNAR